MSSGGKILDMGGRSAIQTAIAFIIAPTKKKRQGAAKKKKENKSKRQKKKEKRTKKLYFCKPDDTIVHCYY